MDTLKTTSKNSVKYITSALLASGFAIFIILHLLGAMTIKNLLAMLFATLVLSWTAAFLRRRGLERYAFIPVLLLISFVSYAASTLLSLGTFTWGSSTYPLLQAFGLFWAGSLFFLLYALTGRMLPTAIAGGVITVVFGIANFAMVQFRGRMFLIGDITALRTAVNVAGTYSLEVSTVFVLAIAAEIIFCVLASLLGRTSGPLPSRRWRYLSRIAVLVPVALYVTAISGGLMNACGIRLTWNENDFEESPVLYFVESISELNVKEPGGYSGEALDNIAASVQNDSATGDVYPTVIVIMDEAFSDLTQISGFETTEEVMPFIDSLMEDTIHGYVYSSVFGGSTANSEFEFLTGCTMAFVPKGVSPYQQYIKYDKNTLVSVLEAQGYTSEALHPYDSSGWNRVAVYNCFGFDEVHFIEDFTNKQYLRGYVSDESDFDNLIRYYEGRDESERTFLFNITMQNHGSYKTESYNSTVSIVGHEGEFPQTEQYLSLIRETDAAMEDLITYFSQQEDPVIILFFGDHQPSLEDEFYDMLYGKTSNELTLAEQQRKYLTPFFIWANYDIGSADLGKTSINYLSPLLLRAAGLESSDFEAFLLEMQAEWPAINAYGYVDSDGNHLPADSGAVSESETLQNYRILQYNYLFDTGGYRKDLFGLD